MDYIGLGLYIDNKRSQRNEKQGKGRVLRQVARTPVLRLARFVLSVLCTPNVKAGARLHFCQILLS